MANLNKDESKIFDEVRAALNTYGWLYITTYEERYGNKIYDQSHPVLLYIPYCSLQSILNNRDNKFKNIPMVFNKYIIDQDNDYYCLRIPNNNIDDFWITWNKYKKETESNKIWIDIIKCNQLKSFW